MPRPKTTGPNCSIRSSQIGSFRTTTSTKSRTSTRARPKAGASPGDCGYPPLAFWLPFVLALYLAMISLMVALRKQWIENERLIFPLVQLPIAMLQDDDARPGVLNAFFKNPLLWIGFAIPAIVQSANGLNHYFPYFPRISLDHSIPLFRDSIHIPIRLSFQMLGFSYFVNRDIAFGLCFFYLLNTVQQGIFNIFGVQKIDPVLGAYSTYTGSIIVHQGFGAVIALVLFGLWTARRHLRDVARKAIFGAPDIDDSGEILSYRAALLVTGRQPRLYGRMAVAVGPAGVGNPHLSLLCLCPLCRHHPRGRRRGAGLYLRAHDRLGLCRGWPWHPHHWRVWRHRPRLYLRVGQRHPHLCHGLLRQRPQAGRGKP